MKLKNNIMSGLTEKTSKRISKFTEKTCFTLNLKVHFIS